MITCQSQSHSLLEKLIDAARILHVPCGTLFYLHALPYQQPPPGVAWTHPIPLPIPVHPRRHHWGVCVQVCAHPENNAQTALPSPTSSPTSPCLPVGPGKPQFITKFTVNVTSLNLPFTSCLDGNPGATFPAGFSSWAQAWRWGDVLASHCPPPESPAGYQPSLPAGLSSGSLSCAPVLSSVFLLLLRSQLPLQHCTLVVNLPSLTGCF